MTINRRSGGDLSVEKARILAAYETSWRNWRGFIAEQKDQLQRQQDDAGGFTDLLGMPLTTASEPIKANLPGDVRQELMRVLELRRQETQAAAEDAARQRGEPPPDRDAVFADVLNHIDRELTGQVHPAGRALVWHEGRLHEFNHRRILSQASDADYTNTLGDDKAKQRRTLIIAGFGVAIIALVFVLLVLTNLDDGTNTATATVREALADGQTVPLWDVTHLSVAGKEFPVTFARAGYPLLLCAPQASQGAIVSAATLVLTGTTSVRTYNVLTSTAPTFDLLIANCGESPPVTLGKGQLTRALTSTTLDPVLLKGVTAISPDIDPATIPADRMQVTLIVDATAGESGTLILADGSRVAPSQEVADAEAKTVSYIYLVPLATTAQPAGWEVSQPGDLPAVLPLTLPAPQTRAQLLRTALTVEDSTVEMISTDMGIAVTFALTVRNIGTQPLTLRATDLLLTQGNTTLPPCDWNPPQLKPNEGGTLEITCLGTLDKDTILHSISIEASLAGWRVRLSGS